MAEESTKTAPPREEKARLTTRLVVGLVLFGVLGGLALLAVTELGLMAGGVQPHGYVLVDEDTCYYGWGPGSYDESSNDSGRLVDRTWTDEQGFRVPERHRDPGGKRWILFVGDSVTEGLYVKAEEAYPAVTAALLAERGLDFAARNGAIRGDTIAQERIEVLGRWRGMHPDAVVIGVTSNDLEELLALKRKGCRLGGAVPAELKPALPKGVSDLRLARVSEDIAARLQRLSPRLSEVRGSTASSPTPAECADIEQVYADLALDVARAMAAQGTPLVFFVHGRLSCGGDQLAAYNADLARKLKEAGASVVDVGQVLRTPGATFAPEDGHPSPSGHRLMAQVLAEHLAADERLAR